MQVVLFGQPELDRRLAKPSVRQLRQRIAFSGRLAANERARGRRLRRAPDARRGLHRRPRVLGRRRCACCTRPAAGVPRLVNILANKSLMLAFGRGSRRVEGRDAWHAARDTVDTTSRRIFAMPAWAGIGVLGASQASGWSRRNTRHSGQHERGQPMLQELDKRGQDRGAAGHGGALGVATVAERGAAGRRVAHDRRGSAIGVTLAPCTTGPRGQAAPTASARAFSRDGAPRTQRIRGRVPASAAASPDGRGRIGSDAARPDGRSRVASGASRPESRGRVANVARAGRGPGRAASKSAGEAGPRRSQTDIDRRAGRQSSKAKTQGKAPAIQSPGAHAVPTRVSGVVTSAATSAVGVGVRTGSGDV